MATVNVTKTMLDLNEPGEITFTAAAANDDVVFDYDAAGDEKLVMLFKGAGTVTLNKGNAIQGTGDDITATVTAEAAVRIDSGVFKNVYGNDKGTVIAVPSAAMDVALIQLP